MIPKPIIWIAVIGAGTAGRDFALLCAGAGFHVILEDVMPARLRHAEEIYNATLPANATGSLSFASTVEEAVRPSERFPFGADLAIDFVPDELESKLEIFCMLDRMAPPQTILLTPTESQNIADLASCTYRPDRCFGVRGMLKTDQHVSLLLPPKENRTLVLSTAICLRNLGMLVWLCDETGAPMVVQDGSGGFKPLIVRKPSEM